MTIDEAIAHAREVAEDNRSAVDSFLVDDYKQREMCEQCAEEHAQLAEWLEELKDYRDKNKMVVKVDVMNIQELKDKIIEAYQQGKADGYSQAENNYHIQTEKDRQSSYDCGYQQGRADAIDEYNGYRRKVIDITITEDFKQLKRVATVDISEYLIKELSQEDLLRVILDEITEQIQKGAEQ